MPNNFIKLEHHDQAFIPASPVSARDLAIGLQERFPSRIFAVMGIGSESPRCIMLVEGIRLGMLRAIEPENISNEEILVGTQWMQPTRKIS